MSKRGLGFCLKTRKSLHKIHNYWVKKRKEKRGELASEMEMGFESSLKEEKQ